MGSFNDQGDQYTQIINHTVAPLIKGMIKNRPSNQLEDGTFLELNNYRSQEDGLERRGGYRPFDLGNSSETDRYAYNYTTYQERVQDIIYYWKISGAPEMLMLTDKQLYNIYAGGAHAPISLVSAGLTISDFTVESLDGKQYSWIVGDESYDILEGDYIREYGEELPVGEIISVLSVTGGQKITVQFDTFTPDALTVFEIVHLFNPETGFKVDWSVMPGYENVIVFTDGNRPIMRYDGVSLEEFKINDGSTSVDYVDGIFNRAQCITYFEERLWFGNIEESGGIYKQRIRWSDATDFDAVKSASYLDLPYSDGALVELVPLGSLLVAYFEDAIYIGRPTNETNLPYKFERLETGGIGVVSQQAVTQVLDGHFFIGQDDVYYLSGTLAIQRIGTPVLRDSLQITKKLNILWSCQIAHDPLTETIAFLFPDQPYTSGDIKGMSSKIWRFNYKTLAWSYDTLNENFFCTSLMPSKYYIQSNSWDEWIDLWPEGTEDNEDADGDVIWRLGSATTTNPDQIQWATEFSSWSELGFSELTDKTLFLGLSYRYGINTLQQVSFENFEEPRDSVGMSEYIIESEIQTQDFNLNMNDINKIVTRISLKLLEPPEPFVYQEDIDGVLVSLTQPLIMKVYVSNDRGLKWKKLTNLKYFSNTDEDKVDLRAKGTNIRFKFIIDSAASTHTCIEYVLRAVGAGLQIYSH